ncbi:hypothetical protein Sjap_005873 [Stephania japonica]|uniref:Uncharacterized protein n=1 Tax=Stephania japonica TaxID=461633 RepID=A0AAP0K5Z5_9MAGN
MLGRNYASSFGDGSGGRSSRRSGGCRDRPSRDLDRSLLRSPADDAEPQQRQEQLIPQQLAKQQLAYYQQLFVQQMISQQPHQSQLYQYSRAPYAQHPHQAPLLQPSGPSLFGPDDPTTLQAYSSQLASQLPPPIAGRVTSRESTHASPSHQQYYQHVPITSFDSSMHVSPSRSHDHVEHASHSSNTSSHPSSEPSISGASRRSQQDDEPARAPRRRSNDDRGAGRVFLTVKTTKEFGTFLHPSSEVSKQMTRIYKFDLHKNGYCWDIVPNHIKEQL